MVSVGCEHLVFNDRSVAAQDNFALGAMLSNQSHDLFHSVVGGKHKRNTDVFIVPAQFTDELGGRRILEDCRWCVEIGRNEFKSVLQVIGARTKDSLGRSNLTVKQFVAHGEGIAVTRTDRFTDTRKQ